MSVRCFALSEPRTLSSNLGQEDELLLNGQHQLHRGEDGLNSGQHHHKEGKVQACHGDLLHYKGKEHNISGLLHHHQRKDQDRPGGRLFQQRHHHHLFSESHLPKTQDALDERGPRRGVGGQNVTRKKKKEAPSQRTFGHHYSICTRPVPTESQNWIKFTFGPLTCFLVMPDLSRKQVHRVHGNIVPPVADEGMRALSQTKATKH
ncbi:hypothetical protein FQN60_004119 [Etheostoma spectabile]|uniref:Uncharacterized protein n=1 Tax=Etheostoma spectabile TaxID=54343 RepID=A0A5J5CYP9_9PERO|nr:hypothetical protein FQN60_004119 [Etheostoma spectabile]